MSGPRRFIVFLAAVITILPLAFTQSKRYRVIWHTPTQSCKKYGLNFTEALTKAGIEVNTGDKFKGDKVVIMYDPGEFPAVTEEGEVRNGGVPQEGDRPIHIEKFLKDLEKDIPNPDFDGLAIIDFEHWRPVWRQNWGTTDVHRKLSRKIERKRHPFWSDDNIEKAARQRFEKSAVVFMEETLKKARRERSKAKWGYYGFPKCYNYAPTNERMQCGADDSKDNDRSAWMLNDSGALYPSIYFHSKLLSEAKRAKLVQGRIQESVRVASSRQLPVIAYTAFTYQDNHQFVSKADMKSSILVPKKYGASGVLLWGSSKDVDTEDKCRAVMKYLNEVLAPIVDQVDRMKLLDLTPSNETTD